ncbi:MAG: hypothetical protein P9L91_10270, partial [Candidatus Zophobacter franzmannii]|nr:hypothetical protein [Candidatus Zophobacter franzmannii]
MKKLKTGIMLFIILFLLWLLLAGINRDELIIGGVTALILSILFTPKVSIIGCVSLHPKAIFY